MNRKGIGEKINGDYLNHLRLAVDILQISESSKQLQAIPNNLNRENLIVD